MQDAELLTPRSRTGAGADQKPDGVARRSSVRWTFGDAEETAARDIDAAHASTQGSDASDGCPVGRRLSQVSAGARGRRRSSLGSNCELPVSASLARNRRASIDALVVALASQKPASDAAAGSPLFKMRDVVTIARGRTGSTALAKWALARTSIHARRENRIEKVRTGLRCGRRLALSVLRWVGRGRARITETRYQLLRDRMKSIMEAEGVVTELGEGAGNVPRTKQGDASMIQPEVLKRRVALRGHREVVAGLRGMWDSLPKCPEPHNDKIDVQIYEWMSMRLLRRLLPLKERAELQVSIGNEWLVESGGEFFMDQDTFFPAIFNFVDVWVDSTDPAAYVALAKSCTRSVSRHDDFCYSLKRAQRDWREWQKRTRADSDLSPLLSPAEYPYKDRSKFWKQRAASKRPEGEKKPVVGWFQNLRRASGAPTKEGSVAGRLQRDGSLSGRPAREGSMTGRPAREGSMTGRLPREDSAGRLPADGTGATREGSRQSGSSDAPRPGLQRTRSAAAARLQRAAEDLQAGEEAGRARTVQVEGEALEELWKVFGSARGQLLAKLTGREHQRGLRELDRRRMEAEERAEEERMREGADPEPRRSREEGRAEPEREDEKGLRAGEAEADRLRGEVRAHEELQRRLLEQDGAGSGQPGEGTTDERCGPSPRQEPSTSSQRSSAESGRIRDDATRVRLLASEDACRGAVCVDEDRTRQRFSSCASVSRQRAAAAQRCSVRKGTLPGLIGPQRESKAVAAQHLLQNTPPAVPGLPPPPVPSRRRVESDKLLKLLDREKGGRDKTLSAEVLQRRALFSQLKSRLAGLRRRGGGKSSGLAAHKLALQRAAVETAFAAAVAVCSAAAADQALAETSPEAALGTGDAVQYEMLEGEWYDGGTVVQVNPDGTVDIIGRSGALLQGWDMDRVQRVHNSQTPVSSARAAALRRQSVDAQNAAGVCPERVLASGSPRAHFPALLTRRGLGALPLSLRGGAEEVVEIEVTVQRRPAAPLGLHLTEMVLQDVTETSPASVYGLQRYVGFVLVSACGRLVATPEAVAEAVRTETVVPLVFRYDLAAHLLRAFDFDGDGRLSASELAPLTEGIPGFVDDGVPEGFSVGLDILRHRLSLLPDRAQRRARDIADVALVSVARVRDEVRTASASPRPHLAPISPPRASTPSPSAARHRWTDPLLRGTRTPAAKAARGPELRAFARAMAWSPTKIA
eukprot:TRINITY_DN7178_c0_g3_i1.p1 TRINITY_DN7178_c0_g3~~TRINITY_DN7178_c0_g3_i1.p1  ORF type:complete len:1209 (+),score=332.29 TRINITY_DN7178_c0_g3_i1:72-3698(+)